MQGETYYIYLLNMNIYASQDQNEILCLMRVDTTILNDDEIYRIAF